jgi:hypothetical protein
MSTKPLFLFVHVIYSSKVESSLFELLLPGGEPRRIRLIPFLFFRTLSLSPLHFTRGILNSSEKGNVWKKVDGQGRFGKVKKKSERSFMGRWFVVS